MNEDLFRSELVADEDYRTHPYDDKTGKAIILPTGGKITIGVGWNLTDNGLPRHIINLLLDISIKQAIEDANRLIPHLHLHSERRQRAIATMALNLGYTKLAKFEPTLAYFRNREYAVVGQRLRRTKWYRDTKARGERIVRMIEMG